MTLKAVQEGREEEQNPEAEQQDRNLAAAAGNPANSRCRYTLVARQLMFDFFKAGFEPRGDQDCISSPTAVRAFPFLQPVDQKRTYTPTLAHAGKHMRTHTYTCYCRHIHTHTHTHPRTLTLMCTCIHAHMRAHAHTHTETAQMCRPAHTRAHIRMHTQAHTSMHPRAHVQPREHTCSNTHAHACKRTHAHA